MDGVRTTCVMAGLFVWLAFGCTSSSDGSKAVDQQSQDVGDAQEDVAQDVKADGAPSDLVPDAGADVSAETCDPSDWGPYGVGVRSLALVDSSREQRPVPTLVVYPTADRPDYAACEAAFFEANPFIRYGEATICAVADAAPATDGRPFPVVFVSHGSGSQKEGLTYLEEFLASHGFVVVAMDHTGNVGLQNSEPADTAMSYTRLLDVRFVMDQLLAMFADSQSDLYGLGDAQRVAVAGHSWGGHAAVVLSGMKYSYEKIQGECQAGTTEDDYACPLLEHQTEIESFTPDSRIKAVVSWAQDIGHASQVAGPNCAGAPGISIPWLMMLGDQDDYLVTQEDGPDCLQKAGGTACMALMHGAGHLGYTDLGDENGLDSQALLHVIRYHSTAFLLWQLAGNQACQAAMLALPQQGGASHEVQCN